jgi:hypothetical protein
MCRADREASQQHRYPLRRTRKIAVLGRRLGKGFPSMSLIEILNIKGLQFGLCLAM